MFAAILDLDQSDWAQASGFWLVKNKKTFTLGSTQIFGPIIIALILGLGPSPTQLLIKLIMYFQNILWLREQ